MQHRAKNMYGVALGIVPLVSVKALPHKIQIMVFMRCCLKSTIIEKSEIIQ